MLCIRLGIWQLDRLEKRKAFNSHVEEMWNSPVLEIPSQYPDVNLEDMEYRSVKAIGIYDFDSQVALRNQYWNDRYGYHLLTPLIIGEGVAVLIDRGWIPSDGNDVSKNWLIYNSESSVEISGIIRLGQETPDLGGRPDPTLTPTQDKLEFWNNVNLKRIDDQILYRLLHVYIQIDPAGEAQAPPIPFQPELELTEGPHLGYAGQWFTFALILFAGYPFFVNKRENQE